MFCNWKNKQGWLSAPLLTILLPFAICFLCKFWCYFCILNEQTVLDPVYMYMTGLITILICFSCCKIIRPLATSNLQSQLLGLVENKAYHLLPACHLHSTTCIWTCKEYFIPVSLQVLNLQHCGNSGQKTNISIKCNDLFSTSTSSYMYLQITVSIITLTTYFIVTMSAGSRPSPH